MQKKIWGLEWDDSLNVGISEIDSEHRHFVSQVNDLSQAISQRMDIGELKRRLQLLLVDTERHFAHEEESFRQHLYPDADRHAEIHAQIRRKLHDIMSLLGGERFEREWIAAGLQIKDILLNHLLTEDMQYRDYCRGRSS